MARSTIKDKGPDAARPESVKKEAGEAGAELDKKAPAKPARKRTSAKPATATTPRKSKPKAETEAAAPPASPKPARRKAPAPKRTAKAAAPAPAAEPERIWLKSYPEGIPAEIEPFTQNSLVEMMLDSCRSYGNRTAFISLGKRMSFVELEEKSRQLAAFLLSLGLQKGSRVALMMPNLLQYPVALMAVLRAGLVVVNVNPLYTARELSRQLKDSGAETIIVLENFAATLQKALPESAVKHVIVTATGDMLGIKGHAVNFVVRRVKRLVPAWSIKDYIPLKRALREGQSATFKPFEVGLDDTAFLQYTGGTTGVAKGAVLLHRNVLANTMQNSKWLETAYIGRNRPRELTMVCALPLYHIYALTVNALMGMQLGAANLLIVNPRDIPGLVKELKEHRFNIIVGLNTLFNAMLNNSEFRKLDFTHLHLTLGGGMAVQRIVADRWREATGGTIHEGYGLSETSPVIAANRFCDEEFSGTIGIPIPSTDVIICDENGKSLGIGAVGELCVRGPQVMQGYWQQPEETANSFTPDGYLKTGDMAEMDERGFIRIVDRKKDMILVSGFNVYPNEIEDVVASHPGVLEAAVIGVPDEHAGEIPKVFVVRKDETLTERDIIDFCRDKLTGYKRPRQVEFRESLPKSNVGKFLRRELK